MIYIPFGITFIYLFLRAFMKILGIWDGHDAGAAIIEGRKVLFAANEERYTKRKLDVGFPYNSIISALYHTHTKPEDIEHVAFSTTELTKTLERVFPSMRSSYYMFRRRLTRKPRFDTFRHNLKYTLTGVGPLPLCREISSSIIGRQLRRAGLKSFKLHVVDHHIAHAACAAFTSPFKRALVITLDGLGDGLSGSISVLENGRLERHIRIPARDSIGIMYEQVTNALGFRELEDEGKVMAMADYSYPFRSEDNRLNGLLSVKGTSVVVRNNPRKQFAIIRDIAWRTPREQVAYMAQQILENAVVKLTSNAIDRYGIGNVVFAGGLFSNVKANMMVRRLETLKGWYVFPHMGDGGLAVGAALHANYELNGVTENEFSAYLGDSFGQEETISIASSDRSLKHQIEDPKEQARHAAELIGEGNYLFWFQDGMEYGPRALGHRSILAPANDEGVKDKLNLYVKRREWFQPFASSILEEDIGRLVDYDGKGIDRFMTNAYHVNESSKDAMRSVVNVDGTTRPQVVPNDGSVYSELLRSIKRLSGSGVVLNTSFNLHGFPIVRDPNDAINTMKETGTKYMFINGVTLINRRAV